MSISVTGASTSTSADASIRWQVDVPCGKCVVSVPPIHNTHNGGSDGVVAHDVLMTYFMT